MTQELFLYQAAIRLLHHAGFLLLPYNLKVYTPCYSGCYTFALTTKYILTLKV